MYIVNNYTLAVILCVVTMLCWGSWGNTQKLASTKWRYELYYWDYVIGILLFSIIWGLTLGSTGSEGRPFIADLKQVDAHSFLNAFTGGIIFNAANILLSTAISLAGMSVAFPVGIGLALVIGVIVNYITMPKGDPLVLLAGVLLIVIAIIINGVSSAKTNKAGSASTKRSKGIAISIAAGILMAFFYRFVAAGMDLENLETPTPGMMTPYTALFVFALGIFASNIIFNTVMMKKPFEGSPVSYREYFHGSTGTHLVGILGGIIWAIGTGCSYIAAGKAGAAISYALGQGATMVAALWGLLIWKEFKGASRGVNIMLTFMFILFFSGLALIIISGGN